MGLLLHGLLAGVLSLTAMAAATHQAGVLRIAAPAEPETLDWNLAARASDSLVIKNLMDGLFELDPQGKPQPALAESFTLSADRLTYVFKIRRNVKWSDGQALSASDFVDSWKRLLAPLSYAPYAGFLASIDGASEFRGGMLTSFDKVGVKALDSQTLQVKLKEPCPYFPQLLSMWVTYPIRSDIIQKYGKEWVKPGRMPVLGPYVLTQYEKGKLLVLKRNPSYYGRAPTLNEARISFVETSAAAQALFKAGEVDVFTPSEKDIQKEAQVTSNLRTFDIARTIYLAFDTSDFPFNLKKVRLAFAKAIDKSGIAKVLQESVRPADSLLPPVIGHDIAAPMIAFDPAGAKALLDETGITANASAKFELLGVTSEEYAYLTAYLQEQFRKNLSISVEVTLEPRVKFDQSFALRRGSLFLLGWTADYVDPQTYMGLFLPTSHNFELEWKGEAAREYDKLVSKASTMPNGPERNALYASALKILQLDDVLIVPLYYSKGIVAIQPWVKGYMPTSALGEVDLRYVKVE